MGHRFQSIKFSTFFLLSRIFSTIIVLVTNTQIYKNIIMRLKAKVEAEKNENEVKDILVRNAPLMLHWRLDKYMARTGKDKRESVIALLESHPQLPEL